MLPSLNAKSPDAATGPLCHYRGVAPQRDERLDRFQTTRWSLILEAREGDVRSRRALETLCRTYRAPVLAYIRARGRDDAEDLAQGFFTTLIERGYHANADPQRGRFRAFLLTALKRYLSDASDHIYAVKRGGNVQIRSLDHSLDKIESLLPSTGIDSPESSFDREWAHAVLHSAMRRLRSEAKAAGKANLFDNLSEFLIEPPDEADYQRVAEHLNMRRNTLAVAVHRMRQRLRELVCRELAQTAADDGDLEQELEDLRHCLGAVL